MFFITMYIILFNLDILCIYSFVLHIKKNIIWYINDYTQ